MPHQDGHAELLPTLSRSVHCGEEMMHEPLPAGSLLCQSRSHEEAPEDSPATGKSIDQMAEQMKLARLFSLDIKELQSMEISEAQRALEEPEARPAYHFRSGAVYTGQWLGRARDGFGVQRWADGTCYEGEWARDRAEGRGRITFANGDVYTGEWLAGAFHGIGAYRARDGTKYIGTWNEDQREGHGVEITEDGVKYAGLFNAGCKDGPGVCLWPDGGQYCGEWANDEINGLGVHRNAKGGVFRGGWLRSARHGVGCHVWSDGRCYMGTYGHNSEVGFGCYFDQEGGQCTVGRWQDRVFHRQSPDTTDMHLLPALTSLAALQPEPTTPGHDEVVLKRSYSWGSEEAAGDLKRCHSGSKSLRADKQRAQVSWGAVDEVAYETEN